MIFETILKTGVGDNTDLDQIATALDLAHKDLETEIRNGSTDKEQVFRAITALDDDHYAALSELRTAVLSAETAKQFPDPIERQTFLHTISNLKMEQGESYKTPEMYKEKIDAINAAADKYSRPRRYYGQIEVGPETFGSFVSRKSDDQEGLPVYDFLVKGSKGEKPTSVVSVGVDREKMVAAAEREKKEYQEYLQQATRTPMLRPVEGDDDKSKRLDAKIDYLSKAPEHVLAQISMVESLRSDEKFKGQIPDNFVENYTTRPLLSIVKGLAETGAAVSTIASGMEPGEYTQDVLRYGEAGLNLVTPGQARNRFEAGDKPAVADLVSQGVESLVTVLLPGAMAKVGMKALPLAGNFGKTISIGLEMQGATAFNGTNVYAGFAATAFGNSFAQRMNFADSLTDPVEAERVRSWAPLLAIADAAKEVITERLLPGDIEQVLLKGVKGTLGQRLFKAGIKAPALEGLEEIAGTAIESLYADTPGTPKSQDPIEAFKGGFFGGLAASPVVLAQRGGLQEPTLVRTDAPDASATAETQPARPLAYTTNFDGISFTGSEAETQIFERFGEIGITTRGDLAAIAETPPETPEEEQIHNDAKVALEALDRQENTPAPVLDSEGGVIPATDQEGIAPVREDAAVSPSPEVRSPDPVVGLDENPINPEIVNENIPPADVAESPAPVITNPSEIPVEEAPPSAVENAAIVEEIAPGIQFHPVDTATEAGQALRLYEQATGKKVALFTVSGPAKDGSITDGFALRDDPNTIFIAANTVQPFLHVLGHETLHTMEQMPGYQEFSRELRVLEPEAWDKARKLFADETQAQREFTADVVGTRFARKDFWDRLEQRLNPGTFKNFVSFVAKVWEKIKATMSPRAVNIKNVAAIDRMIQDLLIKTGTVQPGTAQQRQASARVEAPPTTVTDNTAEAVPGVPVDQFAGNRVYTTEQFRKAVESFGPAVQRTYVGGRNSELPVFMSDSLEAAKAMAVAGKTSEEIRAATGWFPGKYDGKMRWEVPDNGVSFTPSLVVDRGYGKMESDLLELAKSQGVALTVTYKGLKPVVTEAREWGKDTLANLEDFEKFPFGYLLKGEIEKFNSIPRDTKQSQRELKLGNYSVGELFPHDELFRIYPLLENVSVNVEVGEGNYFRELSNSITIEPKSDERVLLHEIQHWIQKEEKFSRGSSLDTVEKRSWEQIVKTHEDQVTELSDAWSLRNSLDKGQTLSEAKSSFRQEYGREPHATSGQLAKSMTKDEIDGEVQSVERSFEESRSLAKKGLLGDPYRQYAAHAGEIESRDVEARRNYTPEQRTAIAPYSSENIAPEDAIVIQRSSVTPEPYDTTKAAAVHTVGGAFLESGTVTFPEWSASVLGTLGEGARQYLRPAYESLRYSGLPRVPEMTVASEIDNPTRKPNPAPGLTPTEQAALDSGATGIKNAVTDELRTSLGVEAALEMEVEHHTEVLTEALARNRIDSGYTDNLISELIETPRQLDQYEEAALMLENLKVQRAIEGAVNTLAETTDDLQKAEAMDRLAKARAKAQALMDIERYAGTSWGRTGNFRRRMLARDYSLVRMEYNYRAATNRGGPLNEEQGNTVTEKHKALSDAAKDVAAAEEKDLDAKVQEYIDAFFKKQVDNRGQFSPGMKTGERKAKMSSARDQERARVKAVTGAGPILPSSIQRSSTIDPNVLADLVIAGVYYIEEKATTLEKFKAMLNEDFGDAFDNYAQTIFNAALEEHATITQGPAKTTGAKKGVAKATLDAAMETAKTTGAILPERDLVRLLVRFQVEQGLRGSKDVIGAVFNELQPIFPGLTPRQVKEIFTDYGKSVFPSKEEVATELRLLRRVVSLEVTIERLKTGLPALKTGLQRDKANKEVRALTRQVNELKKKLGLTQKTPEQLAGALTAAKTRLRNEIEDLNAFIAQGGRRPEQRATRTPAQSDEELKGLTTTRDNLKKDLVALEGKTPLTEDQRVDLTLKSLARMEEYWTRRLETGEFTRQKTPTPEVNNDEIEERRAYLQTLRTAIKEGADAQKTFATPVFRALDAAQKRLDYYLGVMDGSIVPDAPQATRKALSQAEEDIRLQIQAIQQVLAEEKKAANQKPESQRRVEALQKRLDALTESLNAFNATGAFPVTPTPPTVVKTPEEESLEVQIKAASETIRNEKRLISLREKIAQFDRVLQGLEPAPTRATNTRNVPQEEEDLRLELDAMRQVLAEEERAAKRTPEAQRRIEAATKERDRLERVMAGLEAERTARPRVFLTQAEEDLALEIEAMRAALAEERRTPKKSKEQKQLETAQRALDNINDILTGKKLPRVPTPADILTEEEREVREQLETAKAELAAIRRADPARQLKQDKAAIDRRIAELEVRIREKNFTPKPKATRATDKELSDKKLKYENLRAEWENILWRHSMENRSKFAKTLDFFRQGFLSSRLTQLGLDFGSLLRQLGRTIGRPGLLFSSTKKGFVAVTAAGEVRMREELDKDPMIPVFREAGLEITDWNNPMAVTRQEEIWASRWIQVQTIEPTDSPGKKAALTVLNTVTGPIRGLGRGQVTLLNYARVGMMHAMSGMLSRYGAPTMEEMRHYAVMINVSTGRGTMSDFEKSASGLLSVVFLAYRWAKSGAQYVTGYPLWYPAVTGQATLRSSAVVLTEYARNLSGIALIYAAYAAAAFLSGDPDKYKIEWDPRSKRFGKLKFGESMVDPTAGISQWVTFLTKLSTESIYQAFKYDTGFRGKKGQSGRITPLGEGEDGKPTMGTGLLPEIGNFLRTKLNPIVGAGLSAVTGEDPVGEKTDFNKEAKRLVTPLIVKDIYTAMKQNGIPTGTAVSILAFFGMGVQTWEEKRKEVLSTESRQWLYDNGISIPSIQDDATVGKLKGYDKVAAANKGLDTVIPEAERIALLKRSTPAVESAVKEAMESAKTLPTDPDKREQRLKVIQSRLENKVETARRKALEL